MPTLTLKNLPESLHRRLKERAARNHRSLNREAIRLLEQAVAADAPPERDEAWERAEAFRQKLAAQGFWITPEDVDAAIDDGHP